MGHFLWPVTLKLPEKFLFSCSKVRWKILGSSSMAPLHHQPLVPSANWNVQFPFLHASILAGGWAILFFVCLFVLILQFWWVLPVTIQLQVFS